LLFRNLRRAGVLKKSSATLTWVPEAAAQGEDSWISPAWTSRRNPAWEAAGRVINSRRLTAAMLGRASPRNPRVLMFRRSSSASSLLVAWRARLKGASSGSMPTPSSTTRMSLRPPSSISTVMRRAPASREFSTSSLTTWAGRTMTSPAAI
jgi:hypothetical protein